MAAACAASSPAVATPAGEAGTPSDSAATQDATVSNATTERHASTAANVAAATARISNIFHPDTSHPAAEIATGASFPDRYTNAGSETDKVTATGSSLCGICQ